MKSPKVTSAVVGVGSSRKGNTLAQGGLKFVSHRYLSNLYSLPNQQAHTIQTNQVYVNTPPIPVCSKTHVQGPLTRLSMVQPQNNKVTLAIMTSRTTCGNENTPVARHPSTST